MRWLVMTLLVAAACAPTRPPPAAVDDFEEPAWSQRRAARQTAPPQRHQPPTVTASDPKRRKAPLRRRGARVDMDFKDADLGNVFRMLATVGGMNIVLAPGVSGTVTLRLKGVEWSVALETICRAHGLEITADRNVLLIRPR